MKNQPSEQDRDRASISPEIRNAELAHAVQQGKLPRYLAEAYDVVQLALDGEGLSTASKHRDFAFRLSRRVRAKLLRFYRLYQRFS